ncbi:hypothetical protein A3SI_04687 [Nitritalea halalkaliphila LW7]|uniref:Uncharacterized protein n=1 Tax=Nitritalea halalkaliphila LW7 TaxID=1189621 RepID=I5C8C2_9BACT|nr:hypothetical protein [Nitritalea halalkaliphila]EIM78074.1 hypothetical protein A3SI_04687 [Nitritalea halalkaliphila LW7]
MKELKQQMYVQLLYDAEQQAMRLRWIGEVPLQGYKETLLACLDYMRMHDIPLILVDQRELKPLSEAHTKCCTVPGFHKRWSIFSRHCASLFFLQPRHFER